MELRLPAPRAVSDAAALVVLERAVAAHPAAPAPRLKLAGLLFDRDDFSAAIALLEGRDWGTAAEPQLLLSQALVARNEPGDGERAVTAAERAAAQADDPLQRDAANLAAGRALLRCGRRAQGEGKLRAILDREPAQAGAFRSLTDRLLQRGDAAAVLALVEAAQCRGIHHSRLLGAQAAARARTGAVEAARELCGLDRFVSTTMLDLSSGCADLTRFNALLKTEVEGDPDLRHGRYGTASRNTNRVDHPLRTDTPALAALHKAIAAAAMRHVLALAGDHPWVAARPEHLVMRSWCVMTDADGYEEWHNHPAGWMSGGYYVEVPERTSDEPKAGCLAFGMPPALAGAENAAAFGEQLIVPQPGMLALFPSHAYHRTYPHGQPGRRICVAFDLVPA